ncbi:Rha family transcriptional regulator [Macrococcus armenti]|uniref:Rha family transcriptional regulator n=1 Tax=Macrococcus armenti TaxID=2875764 RepID=UPI001CCAF0B3|nr:phage regulatory protein/antirepressor Ant [Macrococcus armenti]UBH07880.1 phage regulatory protein/antirepressor Ant [Macrococcus armenti]
MNALKVIEQNNEYFVDSREVAEMVKKNHAHLMRDIQNYESVLLQNPNLDSQKYFIESTYKTEGNNKTYKHYLLTKKGCDMVANKMTGEKGILFTAMYVDAFHQMQSQIQNRLPGTYKEALLQLVEQVEVNEKLQLENSVQKQQIGELKPKATYYDLVLQNKTLLSVTKIAKDYGMSAVKLNKLLHELKVQYKQGDIWLLYAKYQDKGYTQTSTHVIDDEKSKISTKWTQAGRLFIYDLLKDNGILPMIEREIA